jgi:hypothetical protein
MSKRKSIVIRTFRPKLAGLPVLSGWRQVFLHIDAQQSIQNRLPALFCFVCQKSPLPPSDSTPCINSEIVTSRAWAISSMLRNATFRSPRSIPPIYVRSNPHCAANASCEKPLAFRIARTCNPNRTSMSGFRSMQKLYGGVAYQSTDYEYRLPRNVYAQNTRGNIEEEVTSRKNDYRLSCYWRCGRTQPSHAEHPRRIYATCSTAAPRISPCFNRRKTWLASASGWNSVSACSGIWAASAKNSSASRRVKLATLRSTRSP